MEYVSQLQGFLTGTSMVGQVIGAVVIALVIFVSLTLLENAATMWLLSLESSTKLQDCIRESSYKYVQDPNVKGATTCWQSRNERNGIEFSFAGYFYLKSDTFSGEANSLRHIMHKGSEGSFPLMAPGIFARTDENAIRIYMNSTDKWDNMVEVKNIPVGKWFHLVIMCKGRNIDIYINGNVAYRMSLKTVPKVNFGDVYVFSKRTFKDWRNTVSPDQQFNIIGPARGFVTRLNYYAYALTYPEIDGLQRQGPATCSETAKNDLPPYMADSWWVTYMKSGAVGR